MSKTGGWGGAGAIFGLAVIFLGLVTIVSVIGISVIQGINSEHIPRNTVEAVSLETKEEIPYSITTIEEGNLYEIYAHLSAEREGADRKPVYGIKNGIPALRAGLQELSLNYRIVSIVPLTADFNWAGNPTRALLVFVERRK